MSSTGFTELISPISSLEKKTQQQQNNPIPKTGAMLCPDYSTFKVQIQIILSSQPYQLIHLHQNIFHYWKCTFLHFATDNSVKFFLYDSLKGKILLCKHFFLKKDCFWITFMHTVESEDLFTYCDWRESWSNDLCFCQWFLWSPAFGKKKADFIAHTAKVFDWNLLLIS